MTTLDRASPMPLWAQLEGDLRDRLEAGEFDDRFPTDAELTSQYGVSRHTVREAIRHLNRNGLLRRERGRGTVVTRSEFEQPLGALYSLFRSIEETGVEQRSQVLELDVVVEPAAAAALGLDDAAELVVLARVRWAGDAPLALDRAWLPAELAAPLLRSDFTHTALYDELERVCGFRPDNGWERIVPSLPSGDERRLLGLPRGSAAFAIERLGRRGSRPVEWRRTIIRGDRYRLVVDWSAGESGDLRLLPVE